MIAAERGNFDICGLKNNQAFLKSSEKSWQIVE